MNILDKLSFQDEKPGMFTLKNNEKQQILVFGLKEKQVLKRHTTAIPAILIVLNGSVSFDMNGKATRLQKYDTIDIPVDVPHEVTGEEESVFIVVKEK